MFNNISSMSPVALVLIGTGFTFFCTTLGSAMVFPVKKDLNISVQHGFLGFAAGVMIAASVWSLLIPAIEMSESRGAVGWIPVAGGFIIGGAFLFLLDMLLPHLHIDSDKPEGIHSSLKRTTMLVFAVALHNIPEGIAQGLSFGAISHSGSSSALPTALALALGIGLQNFPEGAAISLPLRNEGFSKLKAFVYGITLGLGTVYVLFFNGAVLGSLTGLIYTYNDPANYWSLILPHGIIELTAVFIAGAAGLMVTDVWH
jgi:ZIP family zinc transporter